jgi:hypothetical protein
VDPGAKRIEYHDAEGTSCCPAPTHVFAVYRPAINQIAAWCEHGVKIKSLRISDYGGEFDVAPKDLGSSSQPSWYRVNERVRFEILERDGFACVWCREPIPRTQGPPSVSEVAVEELSSADAIAELDVDEVQEQREFFAHDADHLFTLDDHDLLKGHVKATTLKKIAKEWIVASCERCNRGRRGEATSIRTILSVYARHLFERSGQPDWDELTEFVSAVKMLRFRRGLSAATGTSG